ncbi:MAG: hypothetical protein J6C29_04810 [Clostridia bacterium]|nr:hypothetical protein [Clostridia bacterium]
MAKYPFKIGVITDEVSQDIFKAAEFAKKHGLNSLEIRSVNNHSPYELNDEDVAEIKKAAYKNGLEIVAISSHFLNAIFWMRLQKKNISRALKNVLKLQKSLVLP